MTRILKAGKVKRKKGLSPAKKAEKRFKKMKKRLWKLFSLWVRMREADSFGMSPCISCGKKFHFKNMNAGHFIHGTWTKVTGFDSRNVWAQCVFCNLGLGGNQAKYADALREKIGQDGIDALFELRHQIWKPTHQEIEGMVKEYEEKLKGLCPQS